MSNCFFRGKTFFFNPARKPPIGAVKGDYGEERRDSEKAAGTDYGKNRRRRELYYREMENYTNKTRNVEDVTREIEAAKANMSAEDAARLQKGMEYDDTRNKLLGMLNGKNQVVLISRNGEEEAILTKNRIGKLMSNEAVGKSMANGFTRKQHYAAAANIDNLFENSTKVLSRPDRANDANVKAIHRFAAPLFEDYAAYITVKESVEHGKRIYSVELIKIGKLDPQLVDKVARSITSPGRSQASPNSNKITNSTKKVNTQSKKSSKTAPDV